MDVSKYHGILGLHHDEFGFRYFRPFLFFLWPFWPSVVLRPLGPWPSNSLLRPFCTHLQVIDYLACWFLDPVRLKATAKGSLEVWFFPQTVCVNRDWHRYQKCLLDYLFGSSIFGCNIPNISKYFENQKKKTFLTICAEIVKYFTNTKWFRRHFWLLS